MSGFRRRVDRTELMKSFDDGAVVAQQNQLSAARSRVEAAPNTLAAVGEYPRARWLDAQNIEAAKVTASNRRRHLKQLQANGFERGGVSGGVRDSDPTAAVVRLVADRRG